MDPIDALRAGAAAAPGGVARPRGPSAGLEASTARMRDEARTIASAKHVVAIAGEVVTIAASIVAMLA